MPFHRRIRIFVAGGLAAGFFLVGARAQTAVETCLLSALQRAPDDASVASVRRQCASIVTQGTASVAPAAPLAGPLPPQPLAESRQADAVAIPPAASEESTPVRPGSPVARRIALEREVWARRFALLPHRPNYIDPFSHAFAAPASVSEAHLQRNEVKFQISFKFALTPPLLDDRLSLFFAYTGQSWWQAYNHDRSSPFREYSHEPELFASWNPARRLLGWDWRLASAGFVHQSNGRSGDSSRSWNRLFADLRFDRSDGWWVGVRPWWRIPEDRKPFAGAAEGDDNPGIERYVGEGELKVGYVGDVHEFTLTTRRSFAGSGKGALQLDWSRPTGFSPNLRWHLQYFDGYGESMLDYRTRVRRIGFGVMLNDWY
ncbi:MAG: phospholipase A [Burkholderiaceae bacterium]|nr:phospholipase A [Burkholderiaceae bacterium]